MNKQKNVKVPVPVPVPVPAEDASKSVEVVLAEIALREKWVRYCWRPVFVTFGGAVMIAATWLPVHELAGRETALNVSIAVTVTIAVSLAGAAGWQWGRRHKARAGRLSKRNERLSRDVKELQQRLTTAGLSTEVSR